LDRLEAGRGNQEEMAACVLCKKGVQEQFLAQSNGSEYVRCSNHGCGYFCAVEDLTRYERVVQLDVASSFAGLEAPSTLHIASVPFASENRLTLLCLSRPLALHVLLLGRFGSHSASADRAAAPAVDPFFTKDDRLESCFAH